MLSASGGSVEGLAIFLHRLSASRVSNGISSGCDQGRGDDDVDQLKLRRGLLGAPVYPVSCPSAAI